VSLDIIFVEALIVLSSLEPDPKKERLIWEVMTALYDAEQLT